MNEKNKKEKDKDYYFNKGFNLCLNTLFFRDGKINRETYEKNWIKDEKLAWMYKK